jgi:16S rRNA processing protein RimM
MMNKLTDIGFISKAHGFGGEVLCVLNEGNELSGNTRFLFVTLEGKPVPFLIEYFKARNDAFLIKFEDVNDETTAKKITGLRLASEQDLFHASSDQLAWADLVGYALQDKNFGPMGTLLSVEEYPEQLVGRCIIREKEVLFPLNDAFVEEIDDDQKRILLDLPEGLLDIYLENGE